MSALESTAPSRRGQELWPQVGVPQRRERWLRVVPDRAEPPARAPFVLLVVVILGVGLVGLLLLNTSLQRGSFAIHDLKRQTALLEEREGALQQKVAKLKAPANLARRAEDIGMVPNTNPVFLRLGDAKVLGDAVPAKARPVPTPAATPAVPPAVPPAAPAPAAPVAAAAAPGGVR